MAKTKLNVFLAKENVTLQDVIKPSDQLAAPVTVGNGVFYSKLASEKKPAWMKSFFEDQIDNDGLRNKTIQAVFVVPLALEDGTSRIFALTFGLGRNLLRLEKFEEQFGRYCVLNLLSASSVKSIDIQSLGNHSRTSRTQLAKAGDYKYFNISPENDVVNKISGPLPIDIDFLGDVKSVNGAQSISLSVTATADNIEPLLKELYNLFLSDDYRLKFKGIDQTRKVKDRELMERLDGIMLSQLVNAGEDESGIVIAWPEIYSDNEIECFRYQDSDEAHYDLDLSDLLELLNSKGELADLTVNRLKNISISAFNANGIRTEVKRVYKCIVADVQEDNRQYVLQDGQWYAFDTDYASNVNDYYSRIALSETQLPDAHPNEHENRYNERCAAENNLIKFDCECINPFNQTRIEVCDLFNPDSRQFIHVKKGDSSSKLSHLFFQSSVSGDLLPNKIVRRQILENIPDMSAYLSEDAFDPASYTIVLAIMVARQMEDGRPHIPFFSKIAIWQTVERLKTHGYNVELMRIPYERQVAP